MSSDFTAGLVSGVLATILGFALTMAWEIWRDRRAEASRARGICAALIYELDENQAILAANRSLLENEQQLLTTNLFRLDTSLPFKHDMWFILKSNLPSRLLREPSTLPSIRDAALAAVHLNEGSASRQRYKDTSGAMSNFTQMLIQRNAGLLEELGRYETALAKARGEVSRVQDAI